MIAGMCSGAVIGLALVVVVLAGAVVAALVARRVGPQELSDHGRRLVNRLLVAASAFRSRRRHPGAFECPPACSSSHTYTWPCEMSAR